MDMTPLVTSGRSAAPNVLETAELLEMILEHMHPFELLQYQRVSHFWKGLISRSPALQRKLFMRPDWNLEVKSFNAWRPENKPGERPKNNRMIRRVLGGANYPTVSLRVTECDEDVASTTHIVEKPDNSDDSNMPRLGPQATTGHWSWDINITYPAGELLTKDDPAIMYEKASWRKMYISQPPCTTLYLSRRWQRAATPAIHCEEGITMEIFMDKMSKARELWDQLFISSDRDWHLEGPVKCSRMEANRANSWSMREKIYDQYTLERLYGTGYLQSRH